MSRKFSKAYAVAVGAAIGAWQGWWAVLFAPLAWLAWDAGAWLWQRYRRRGNLRSEGGHP